MSLINIQSPGFRPPPFGWGTDIRPSRSSRDSEKNEGLRSALTVGGLAVGMTVGGFGSAYLLRNAPLMTAAVGFMVGFGACGILGAVAGNALAKKLEN